MNEPRPPLLAPWGVWAGVGIVSALAGAGLRVALVPLFITPLADRVLAAADFDALPQLLALGAILATAVAIALFVQETAFGYAGAERARRWRSRLHRVLLASPSRTGEPESNPQRGTSGGLTTRILSDLREIENYLQAGFGVLVAEGATMLVTLLVLAWTEPRATAGLLLLTLPALLAMRVLGRRVEDASGLHQTRIESLAGRLQEHLKHRETLRSFGAARFASERFEPASRALESALRRRVRLAALSTPVVQVLVFVAVGILILWLLQAVAEGRLRSAEVIGFITLVALLSTPAQLLPRGVAQLHQARAAANRLRALDRAPTPLADPVAAGPAQPRVVAEQLRLALPDGRELAVPDATFAGAGMVAVVGPSGVGKSSLLRSLLGLLPPAAGTLEVAGVRVDAVGAHDEAALRARVGYVAQGAPLLSGSVRENLDLGRGADAEALWRALAAVGLEGAVRQRELGLDTPLGEDGAGFSGGQQQRLALARALVGNPPLLLLDEPTSALDAASEAELVTLLLELAQERQVWVVSHRPVVVAGARWRLRVAGERIWSEA